MAAFDFNLFNSLLGAGGNPFAAAGTAFGVPSCILQLGLELLSLIPTPILAAILRALKEGMRLADSVVKAIFGAIRDFLGMIGILTEDGEFKLISKVFGFLGDNNVLQVLAAIAGFSAAIAATAGNLYANYQNVSAAIQAFKECLDSFKRSQELQSGLNLDIVDPIPDPVAFQDYVDRNLANAVYEAQTSIDFIQQANELSQNIMSVMAARAEDPSLEPIFNAEACEFLNGTILQGQCVTTTGTEAPKEVIRLTFGPPVANGGQFILSNDGLYFDSQTDGLIPVLTYIQQEKDKLNKGDLWKFMHNPNLGGRGKGFSSEDLKLYVNTLLDPASINESSYIRNYYDADGFLQELISNKNKRIYDLSAQINDLEVDNASQMIITNLRQSLISENQRLLQQVNKRKKQIELAVVLPQIYGSQITYNVGQIPINDFSYLADINIGLDLQKQKALTFSQVEVSGVVSPIQTTTVYVQPRVNTRNSNFEHLIIAENGDGAIIYDGSSVSATDGVVLQTENSLTIDGLFAMYNFLDTDVVQPSSTDFFVRNSASNTNALYAQLVAENQEYVYSRGLGIPYLQGITRQSNSSPTTPSALGSFVRLPYTNQFNDLLYNNQGATIDFWVHVPDILTSSGVGDVSSLYRLVLSNENVGCRFTASTTDSEYVPNVFGTDYVRGFMLGFTRDRRLVTGSPASNDSSLNPASQTCFFLAPTQSISASAATLINRSAFDGLECKADTKYHSMTRSLNGSLANCSSTFCHFAVTFNPRDDEISMYFDGEKVATSSMSYVFGIPKYTMPNLPNTATDNSFEYGITTVGAAAPTSLKYGPKLDGLSPKVTPWIVGGGYTDGLFNKGNFMGGTYGGVISGLRGFIGSIKFYNKYLNYSEVLNNYNTHKNFFKNIDTSKL